jgi:hypothetical protein
MKIAPASLTVNQLFGSVNEQYVIPTYQRRYSWHERQVVELIEDIELLEDGDMHLLGSIVCLAGAHTAGINQLELVDGQQRLTTIAILLECIRQRLEREDKADEAKELAQLLYSKPLKGSPLKKVALDSLDSEEYLKLIEQTRLDKVKNYNLARTFEIIRKREAEVSLDDIRKFSYRLRNQAIVIRLDVSEAKDAFKLFETINNRGLHLSPTDIIKNFLLGNAARFSPDALQLARSAWASLLSYLDGTSTDAFFRYYLMALLATRVTASEVVANFKASFMRQVKEATTLPERHVYADESASDDDEASVSSQDQNGETDTKLKSDAADKLPFSTFLSELLSYAKLYGEIVLAKTDDERVDRHLRNLKMIKAVQTYGFLMHLRHDKCPDKVFRQILKLTESFVLRRHVCKERANDTEALFARLCGVDSRDPLQATKDAYRELCPSDENFKKAFVGEHFSANLIERARYCLQQFEAAKHGSHEELVVLGADDVHVEHIVPQKIKTKKAKDEFGDWVSYLGKNAEDLHRQYVDRIGNLTLFAGSLNIGASNNPFGRKKRAYKESAILITKELASKSNFKFRDIDRRSTKLADLAVDLWPLP